MGEGKRRQAMPGIVRYDDPQKNVTGELLGTFVEDDGGRPISVTPATGTSTGPWIELKSYDKISLSLWADGDATFQVFGSNLMAPQSTDVGMELFSDQTISGGGEIILAIKTPIRWIRVHPTSNNGNVLAPFTGI